MPTQIVEEQYEAACEGSTPYCVQCGPPGEEGAAICLSSSHVPDQCSHVGYVPADEGSCAVENITYKDGDRIGSVQNTCINDKAFNGAQAYCVGGKVKQRLQRRKSPLRPTDRDKLHTRKPLRCFASAAHSSYA